MTKYLIVVKRGKSELRTILEIAFQGRESFTVIEDRRVVDHGVRPEQERRQSMEPLQLEDFLVAERSDNSES
jgi:hypothetical protein